MLEWKYTDHIPPRMIPDILHRRRVQISKTDKYEVVLTKEPHLYETRFKEVMSSSVLPKALVTGISGTTDYSNRIITICFAYHLKKRYIFYILHILDKLMVLLKEDNQLTIVKKMMDNVNTYITDDPENNGNLKLIIQRTNDSNVTISLNDYCYEHRGDVITGRTKFSKSVFNMIQEQKMEAQTELNIINLDAKKCAGSIIKKLRLDSTENSADDKLILARYGDIWIRYHNGTMVVGVPIYNCTYNRKILINDLKAHLTCESLCNFEYTFNIYNQINDDYLITLENLLLDDDVPKLNVNFTDYSMDWQKESKNLLPPEQAAMVIITIKLDSYMTNFPSTCNLHCFLTYSINDLKNRTQGHSNRSDQNIIEKQYYVGQINLNCGIFFNDKFHVRWNSVDGYQNILRDFLTVISTSHKCIGTIDLPVGNNYRCLYDFLKIDLKFTEINMGMSRITEKNASDMDVNKDNTQSLFYTENYPFSGTLLRIKQLDDKTMDFKIYARTSGIVSILIKALSTLCDITLTNSEYLTIKSWCQAIVISVNNELEQLSDSISRNVFNDLQAIVQHWKQRSLLQFNTDVLYLDGLKIESTDAS